MLTTAVFSGKLFAAGNFGIGALFDLNFDQQTVDVQQIGLGGALTMAFGDKQKPIVWDILVGSRSNVATSQTLILGGTRVDFQLFSYSPNDNFSVFIGPGVGLDMTLNLPKDPQALINVIGFQFRILGRLVAGIKLFANDATEFFLQVAPQIGWQFSVEEMLLNIPGISTETSTSTVNDFYWSVDVSVGIRFWP